MTREQSKFLRKLKLNMLNTLLELLKIPNLTEQDRLILFDILKELVDERTQYDIRLRAFTKRNYIIEAITHRYATIPSYSKPVELFDMFSEDEDMPF